MSLHTQAVSRLDVAGFRLPAVVDVGLTLIVVGLAVRISVDFAMNAHGFGGLRLANGVVLGILLSVPRRSWPAYLAAGFLGNVAGTIHLLGDGRSLDLILAVAGIVTAERAACAIALLPVLKEGPDWFGRRFVSAFVAIALFAVPLAGAALVGAVFALRTEREFGPVAFEWFVSGSLGMAMTAPLVLVVRKIDIGEFFHDRFGWLGMAIFAAVALTSSAVFFFSEAPVVFLTLPPLALAAFRLGLSGAALANFIMAAIILSMTVMGHGPFTVSTDPVMNLRFAQAFVFVSIVVTLSIAATVTNHRRVALTWKMKAEDFEKLLNIDMTTELPNRRAIERKIEEEWDMALKTVGRPPLSLAVISIDDFDTLTAGARRAEMDEGVANFSRNLRLIVRRTDWLARISDREFAVLMIQTGKAAAMEAVQTLYDLAQSFNFASVGRKPTLSIGVATIRPNRGREAGELPDLADLALVQARRKGGNCIEWRGKD